MPLKVRWTTLTAMSSTLNSLLQNIVQRSAACFLLLRSRFGVYHIEIKLRSDIFTVKLILITD